MTQGGDEGGERTQLGYAPSEDASSGVKTALEFPAAAQTSPLDNVPLVDIEVVYRQGTSSDPSGPLHTLEVVTLHTTYVMDPGLVCVEVRDRHTGAIDPTSKKLGMRLVGGQSRKGDDVELTYPFPRPGTEAVFEREDEKGPRLDRTSTVMSVKLRLFVVQVSPQVVTPTWAVIRSSIAPGPKS